ncbi:MAG: site-specific integrase [Bacteroidota bacterium]
METTDTGNLIPNNTNVTCNLELASKPSKNGLYNVYLRITENRKHRRKKINVSVKKEDFNKKAKFGKWIRTSNPREKQYNDYLIQEYQKAEKELQSLELEGKANKEILIQELKGSNKISFTKFADQRAKYFYDKGSYRNYKKYKSLTNKLSNFRDNEISFKEINLDFIREFESFLFSLKNKRRPDFNLHKNTIAVHFSVFRAIIQEAIKNRYMKPENNPFMYYKPTEIKTQKEKLTIEEIDAINKLELPENSLLWNCRNYFMFSFYCAGIRAGDLCLLKWNNITKEKRLEYTMGKTSNFTSIKIQPQALKILSFYGKKGENKDSEYIFPLLSNTALYSIVNTAEEAETLPIDIKIKLYNKISSMNALINKELKTLAVKANIEKKLSFHIARHSFADIARKKKISVFDVSKMLKHSSIKITEAYLRNFDTESQDQSMKIIFNTK